ncbi:unnamed protein product [Oikopleura dioica]|uniref:Uncharacterized protein n=1 Tax=Oikopleura dioica TaxID=34765 RepID=E4YLD7_OIKDI|nr:unnamed protein product [Oikopleura dioica]
MIPKILFLTMRFLEIIFYLKYSFRPLRQNLYNYIAKFSKQILQVLFLLQVRRSTRILKAKEILKDGFQSTRENTALPTSSKESSLTRLLKITFLLWSFCYIDFK